MLSNDDTIELIDRVNNRHASCADKLREAISDSQQAMRLINSGKLEEAKSVLLKSQLAALCYLGG
jgi:hypothetical protein